MTSRSYFGKMNSTLGSDVPLAMFYNEFISQYLASILMNDFPTFLPKQPIVASRAEVQPLGFSKPAAVFKANKSFLD